MADQQTDFLENENPTPIFPETDEYQKIMASRIQEFYARHSYPFLIGLYRKALLGRTYLPYARDTCVLRENLQRKPLYCKGEAILKQNIDRFKTFDSEQIEFQSCSGNAVVCHVVVIMFFALVMGVITCFGVKCLSHVSCRVSAI